MSRSGFAALAAAETAILLAYFAKTRIALPLSDWLGSFRWEPVTGDFGAWFFAAIVLVSLSSLAIYGAWLAVCWAAGSALLREIGWKGEKEAEVLVSLGLGLGLAALSFFVLCASGRLTRPGAILAAACFMAAGAWHHRARASTTLHGFSWEPLRRWAARRENLPLAVIALLCAASLFFHLCGALLPPLSFDEMNYQLSLPNLYILNRGFVPTPFNHLSFLPRNMGMLFAAGLLTGGASVAKLFSSGMGVLGTAAIFVFNRRRLGGRAAFLGAALFLLAPVVANQLRVAGADLGTAFFELLGVFLLFEWFEAPGDRTLALSSIFWGLAMGCKYTALPGFFASGCVLAYFAWKKRVSPARTAALYILPALTLWSPWLVKNWLDCGNPVAPLLSTLITSRNFYFAGSYQPMVDYTTRLGIENYFPLRGAADLLRLPWDLTVSHNDFNHDLGPVFLMCFPLWAAVIRGKRAGRVSVLVFLCTLYWGAWFVTGVRMSRYFVAGMGLTSLLCGWLLAEASAGLQEARSWLLLAPFLVGLTQQSMRAVWIQNVYKKPWGYLSGRCSTEEYIRYLQADSPIDAERFINERLPRDARILVFNEFRTFYLERDFLASTPWDHDYWHELVRLSRDPEDFIARVRRLRLTHILANDNYVLHQVGVPLLHPDRWTDEDRAKGVLFLRKCAWVVFRDDGVWVARFFAPADLPKARMPEAR